MPMLVLQCLDGTVAGYTCHRSTKDGTCRLLSPHCPPAALPADGSSGSASNGTSTNSTSPRYIIHHGPYHVPSFPYNPPPSNATSASSFTAYYSSAHPAFNCSRRQCGASIMPIVRTCPDGSHAYPLCAWVTERQHCGYLDPSCSYPGRRDDPPSTGVAVAEVEELYAAGRLEGSGGGINVTLARQRCESGGCMLPMYIKLCPDGSHVRPHCVWSSGNGTQLCLASEPKCPTEAEVAELHSRVVTDTKNDAVLRGASVVVVGLAAILALLAV